MTRRQRTVGREISCSGRGLHTGSETKVTFKPAPVDTGVRFVRMDLPEQPEIPADIEHVIGVFRGTDIGFGGVEVRTVEHVLASLAGLQIDNVRVELSSNEPPVGDGSALPFVEPLLEAGIVEQDSPKDYFVIEEMISYDDLKFTKGVELVVLPSDDFKITFMSDPKNPTVGTQYTTM